NHGRAAVLGDWGTNLYGAPKCRESIERDAQEFTMLLHLGDVYYSGTSKEVSERFLNAWPARKDKNLIHRALNSNHEMYSGGDAYFGLTLPAFRQSSSYFAMANDHWVLVGLDTAYGLDSALQDHDIDEEQVKWIEDVLDHPQAKKKKVLFMSHHQLYSQFESQGDKLASRLANLLSNGRVDAWIWGHEHRCVMYASHPDFGGLKASCIGHGGMPDTRSKKVTQLSVAQRHQTPSGEMQWRSFDPLMEDGRQVCPGGLVLDGENLYIKGEEREFSPHGYAVLNFKGADLIEEIYTPDGTVIHTRNLA
ncbi:MAG: metallophosphoesterase, partial [Verrucomicrobium sp.]